MERQIRAWLMYNLKCQGEVEGLWLHALVTIPDRGGKCPLARWARNKVLITPWERKSVQICICGNARLGNGLYWCIATS